MATFAVAFGSIVAIKGVPADLLSIFSWLWILSVCWNVEAPPRAHLAFPRDWTIPLVFLLLYFYSREIADNLGIPVEYHFPIAIDEWLGGGTTPSALLQHTLCGDPCDPTGSPSWYDRIFILVWMSHFVVGLSMAVVYWLRNRAEWVAWMRRYLTACFVGLFVYIMVPTAPPWMATRDGQLGDAVVRIGARAWVGPKPEGVGNGADPSSWAGNDVAAMPSLHTAIAVLVALYAIQRFRTSWRWASVLYPLAMGLTLVYFGEQYVADLLAGALLAIAVHAMNTSWEARRRARRLPANQPETAEALVDA